MAVAITLADIDADGTDASSYTFTDKSIGTAAADRVVVVGVAGFGNAPSGVTIGGVAATQLVLATLGTTGGFAGLWALAIPSGTTATIAVTIGGSADRCGVAVWRLTGTRGSITPLDTDVDEDGNNSGSLTLNTVVDGGVIGYAYSASDPNFSWTGVTKEFEFALETSAREQSGGTALTSSNNASYSITFSAAGGGDTVGCAVSFAPAAAGAARQMMHYRRLRV